MISKILNVTSIDEAVLDLVEVNDEVKELPAKVTVAIDAGTVRNENVKTEDLPDFSGAPTSEEWNKYIDNIYGIK